MRLRWKGCMDATAEGAMEADLKLLSNAAPKCSQATAAMFNQVAPFRWTLHVYSRWYMTSLNPQLGYKRKAT